MIAIVGAGVAGLSAAETVRASGYLGRLRVFDGEAATPYERPNLSKGFLQESNVEDPPSLTPLTTLERLDIRLDTGVHVLSISPSSQTLLTSRHEEVEYDLLLLATGAQPRRLSLPGHTLDGVCYLRNLEDARTLRAAIERSRNVVIIGGGVIGLEVAASASLRGCRVTVLEAAARVMGRVVPGGVASLIEQVHRERGVDVRTATVPVAFEGSSGRIRQVGLASGESVPADVVVVGVGVEPCTRLAEDAGLDVDNGIVVDAAFRTSSPQIFAAGDVARVFNTTADRHLRIEQWEPAREQGRQAAASMLGAEICYREIPWMWSDQFDVHVRATGLDDGDVEVVRGTDLSHRGGICYFGLRDGRLVRASGASIGTSVARLIRAAHILIEHQVDVADDVLADPGVDLHRLARGVRS